MRRGDIREINLGSEIGMVKAAYLGKGRFAEAWQVGDSVYLFVAGCHMKEALQEITMPHVPRIDWVGEVTKRGGKEFQIYRMPYYRTLTARDEEAWADYKELARAREQAWSELRMVGRNIRPMSEIGYQVNDRTIELAQVSEPLKEALREIADRIANYGSGCTWEFAPRNLGVDEDGRLILRDIAYDAEPIEKELRERHKKYWGKSL